MKKVLLLVLTFFVIVSVSPKTSQAASLRETLTSENSIITKVTEGVEYFFAFKVENKVQVLEKHAEKRLEMAQEYAEEGNNERVQNLVQSYLEIKEKENNFLDEIDGQVLGTVAERTIEQQKTMEEIKTKTTNEIKNEVIQIQEQVVNRVAQRIVDVNGTEGQTEFLQEVVHVWAPGTGPGGEAGIVIDGGTSDNPQYAPETGPSGTSGVIVEGGTIRFAPETSAGGPSSPDIQTTEVVTGGGENNVVEGGHENEISPDANPGVNTEVTSPGTKSWVIDP